MKKYYKNIAKEKAAPIITAAMLLVAVLCIGIISVNHEDNDERENTEFVKKEESKEDYMEAFLYAPQADIETRLDEVVLMANGRKKTVETKETAAKEDVCEEITEKETTPKETKEKKIKEEETKEGETQGKEAKKAKEEETKAAAQKKKTTKKTDKAVYTKKKETVYVVYDVNVRKSPEGEVIGGLAAGEKITRTAQGSNGWSRVSYKGKTAYIYSFYLCANKAQITEGIAKPKVQSANVEVARTVSNHLGITVTKKDYYWLQQIVQAEAGNQDEKGRILVANAIINRVKSATFPNTITEVIFQSAGGVYQFSPVDNGTIYTVAVDEVTKNCVNRALNGESYSGEVLYFSSEHSPYSWHNTSLSYLFTWGDHAFYR